jgi:hypothetical protein
VEFVNRDDVFVLQLYAISAMDEMDLLLRADPAATDLFAAEVWRLGELLGLRPRAYIGAAFVARNLCIELDDSKPLGGFRTQAAFVQHLGREARRRRQRPARAAVREVLLSLMLHGTSAATKDAALALVLPAWLGKFNGLGCDVAFCQPILTNDDEFVAASAFAPRLKALQLMWNREYVEHHCLQVPACANAYDSTCRAYQWLVHMKRGRVLAEARSADQEDPVGNLLLDSRLLGPTLAARPLHVRSFIGGSVLCFLGSGFL